MTNQREYSHLNPFKDLERSNDMELRLLAKLCLGETKELTAKLSLNSSHSYLLACSRSYNSAFHKASPEPIARLYLVRHFSLFEKAIASGEAITLLYRAKYNFMRS